MSLCLVCLSLVCPRLSVSVLAGVSLVVRRVTVVVGRLSVRVRVEVTRAPWAATVPLPCGIYRMTQLVGMVTILLVLVTRALSLLSCSDDSLRSSLRCMC